mmetsp:Transcript_55143/g.108904  ORF Transcript_55143/g.108904 Transcript_55143/m.108904 type:complete len:119 (+) Transcript_55143:76-432(+)
MLTCCASKPDVGETVELAKAKEVDQPAAVPAKESGFDIKFKSSDGTEVTHRFTKKPLGFKFRKAVPVVTTVILPGSHADEVGVKSGLEIVAIDGMNVQGMSYEDVVQKIKDGSAPLAE